MKVFYFTSTGNSLEVAKAIGGELLSIPKILKEGQSSFEDDAIGIVFPCYALGAPPIVQKFIQKVKLKSPYIFAIMTYGNFEGGGVDHFHKIARQNSIELSYLNSILMVDNYLNFFHMEKQLETLPAKKVEVALKAIAKDIAEKKNFLKKPWFLMRALSCVSQMFNPFKAGNKDENFVVEDHCNGCKLCEKVCPVDNIKVEKTPVFLHKCISCYACTHNCPQNAIRVKGERSKARFRNKNVAVEEIIEANS